jgi:hypothetical protein
VEEVSVLPRYDAVSQSIWFPMFPDKAEILASRVEAPFLGAFAKLRKATISLVKSVRPHGKTRLSLNGFLIKFYICDFFQNSVEKI